MKDQEAAILKNPREFVFSGLSGCSNHGCIMKHIGGMGTNGSCHCFTGMNRTQLNIVGQRLNHLLNLLEDKP